MSLYIGQGAQALNVHYQQDISSKYLNKQFQQVFNPGVIYDGTNHDSIINNGTSIEIGKISLFITPSNLSDTLLKVDTTTNFTINIMTQTATSLIARYTWVEDENTATEFTLVEPGNVNSTDVLICELTINTSNNITAITFDNQSTPYTTLIQPGTVYTDANKLDCREPGHFDTQIPINDGTLNINSISEFINGTTLSEMSVNNGTIQEGLVSGIIAGYSQQPQDGVTSPGSNDRIPLNNGMLQIGLNAQYLNGLESTNFALSTHSHNLSNIIDNSLGEYKRVANVSPSGEVTSTSIINDDIGRSKLSTLFYDHTHDVSFKPFIQSGEIDIPQGTYGDLGNHIITFPTLFANTPRIFVQVVRTLNIAAKMQGFYNYYADKNSISNSGCTIRLASGIDAGYEPTSCPGDEIIVRMPNSQPINQHTIYWIAIGQGV